MTDSVPNVLWLHSDRTGCGTYRCYVPSLSLDQSNGGSFDTHFLLHNQCLNNKQQLDGIDVVVFQRAVGPLFLDWARECRRRDIKVVFEMDDDLFNISKGNPAARYWHEKPTQRHLRGMLDFSDHLIVSTEPLKESVMVETRRKDISVCYNHLHPSVWGDVTDGQLFENFDKTVIGWQGSNTHDADFREALPALTRILADYPNVLFRFFGSVPLTIKGHIPESRFQWARGVPFDRYPATLRFMHFDIGLAPVTNSKFNRAKSNLKWLEYASLGIPCVASNVYPYGRTGITHGETGFLAASESEWYTALATLIESAEMRARIGETAKAHVWDKWGPHRADAWATVFSTVLGREVSRDQPVAQLAGPA